ncbi:hypothetical protein ACPEIF_14985 [Streptomyces sp. NPDC012600]|uniref:Secreted protein n=1 Tax=Streptomyces stephensoniae TaxID=3375367 RepID=A0ABU2W7T3_9ACTN|nr:hypothetical protein [Streptomyces griseus]MDT0493946.1 hypothetical protein [Streptomyces griseus]
MTLRRKLVSLAATGVLVGGGLVAATTSAGAASPGDVSAQSCYGSAKSYTKKTNYHLVPLPSQTPQFFTTTSNCSDINIKTNSNRSVKVCFYTSSGALNYCQADYKSAKNGVWKVIATNVKNNVKFRFYFSTTSAATGTYAA